MSESTTDARRDLHLRQRDPLEDLSDANLLDDLLDAEYSRDLLLALGAGGRWAGYNDGSIEFRRWTVEELPTCLS